MKILINTSTQHLGGGGQVALSFIEEISKLKSKHQFFILCSNFVFSQLHKSQLNRHIESRLITPSPAKLRTRKRIVKYIKKIEIDYNPDIVFSVFGPTYWRPKSLHIMGFANPYIINPDSIFFKQLNIFLRIKYFIENLYKGFYVKRDADFYITETENTKNKLSNILSIPTDRIFIVGNTYNSIFDSPVLNLIQLREREPNEIRLVTITKNHPHKNLKIIQQLIPEITKRDINIKFYVTIDNKSYHSLFSNFKEFVINVGPISTYECPSLYHQCDALFLPTLLESFTASYPEAMKVEIPILTSDLPFARDICQDAAVYFDPLDVNDIISKILLVLESNELRQKCIDNGKSLIKTFETAKSRAIKYLNICEKIVDQKLRTNKNP